MKIIIPDNNGLIKEVLNDELIEKVIISSFSKKVDYIKIYEKRTYGQYIILETNSEKRYIVFSAKSAKDTRNGFVAAKMTVPFRDWFNNKTTKQKSLALYLLDVENRGTINPYNTFVYRLIKAYEIKILNEKELPFNKYRDLKYKNFIYRKNEILFNTNIKEVSEIKKARDQLQSSNKNNKSSYILEAEDYHIVYGKVDGNSEFEIIFLTCVIAKLAKKENKKVYFYQVEEIYGDSIGIENKKLLEEHGVEVYDGLKEYMKNPDLFLNESKTSRDQATFYLNLFKKYSDGTDIKKCYLCDCDIQETIIAAHIQRIADINKLDIPFTEKRKKATDANNGFWLCANHDKLFEFGIITFNEEGKLRVVPEAKLTDSQKEYINRITDNDEIKKEHFTAELQEYLLIHNKRITNERKKKNNQNND